MTQCVPTSSYQEKMYEENETYLHEVVKLIFGLHYSALY